MSALITTVHHSPVGPLRLVASARGLRGLYFTQHRHAPAVDPAWRVQDDAFDDVRSQLDAYFAGALRAFALDLDPVGSAFQCRVWDALSELPYASTTSYGELAAAIGAPGAARAVGLANGRNPLSVIVPCHRVVGSDGRLTGYGGGLPRKAWLLEHEQRVAAGAIPAAGLAVLAAA